MRSAEYPFTTNIDLSVSSKEQLSIGCVAVKLANGLRLEDGIQMVITPLEQTITYAETQSYNKAIADAIKYLKAAVIYPVDGIDGQFVNKSNLLAKLEALVKH